MRFLNIFKKNYSQILSGTNLVRKINTSSSGETVSPRSSTNSATVYLCAKIISEDVAKLPISLYKKGKNSEKEKVLDSSLYNILHHEPNSFHTPIEFWEMMVWDLVVRANAYAFISRSTRGEILELLPLEVEAVRIQMIQKVPHYYITTTSGEKQVPRENILHIRDLVSHDTGYGRTRVNFAAEAFGLEIAGEKLTGKLFKNGLRMTPVLSHPKNLGTDARKRLKEDLTTFSSGENAYDPMLLEEGMDWKPAQMTIRDAQLLELRNFSRSTILSLYRMPPHKAGEMDRATYSNVELKEREYVMGCLLSWVVKIEQAIYRDLFSKKEKLEKHYVKFNINSLVRADMITRFNAYQIGIRAGMLSPDEAREKEDLEKRADGRGGIYLESGDLYPSGEARNAI